MVRQFPMLFLICFEHLRLSALKLIGNFKLVWIGLMWGVAFGNQCSIIGKIRVRTHQSGTIRIGNAVSLLTSPLVNVAGVCGEVMLDTRSGGVIVIGDGSGLTSTVIASKRKVSIGCNVKIGANCRIYDHDFHNTNFALRRKAAEDFDNSPAPVEIGDDVFIGTNVIILKGTKIGDRSLVAAGSVVFGLEVPPDSLVKGNPAVIVERK